MVSKQLRRSPSPDCAETGTDAATAPIGDMVSSAGCLPSASFSSRSILFQTSMIGVVYPPSTPSSPSTFSTSCGLRRVVRVGDVADVEDDVGVEHFFERGAEGGDQLGRQVGDEADGIRQHDLAAMRQRELADGGVEGGEEQVLGEHPCPGQRVEDAGFSGVGVADQRHDRERHGVAPALLLAAGRAHLLDALFEQLDAVLQLAAVAFELGFARTTHEADAARAALALKVGPGADQPALLIVEMRQFDLQHAFARRRPLAEDLEDQPGAVEHLGAGFLLEIALLDRMRARHRPAATRSSRPRPAWRSRPTWPPPMKVAGLISRTLTMSEKTISTRMALARPSNSAFRASMRVAVRRCPARRARSDQRALALRADR